MNESKWFTASLSDAQAMKHPVLGIGYLFGEQVPREKFRDFGINIRVVEPGQPTALYHAENAEELFLVLAGECVAIVDEEEVTLRQWDFLHCPAGTPHVIVGGGDGPATVLMVGGRGDELKLRYPVSDVAANYGVSVDTETTDGQEAWQQRGLTLEFEHVRLPWPP